MTEQQNLLDYARTLHRASDPSESADAAAKVAPNAARSQRLVRGALAALGSATDEQVCEYVTRFVDVSPSRLRTARAECVALGLVERVGTGVTARGGKSAAWGLVKEANVA